jgi:hypothetical protein
MNRKAHTDARPITLRLTVADPPAGVRWAIQLGRDQLSAPESIAHDSVVFRIPLELVADRAGTLRLRGAAVQGPPGARFVYLNSGTRAGDARSCWDRRAKIPLTGVPLARLHALAASDEPLLDGAILGTAKDGGPTCASVPLLGAGWVLDDGTG